MRKSIRKYVLIAIGSIAVSLGFVGVFLPILPTTPFFLLASFCYLRSSDRLYQWLIHHRMIGAYLYNYITYKAVLKSTKIIALLSLWIGLSLSMILVDLWMIRVLLLVVGIGVSIHLGRLKTITKEEMKSHTMSKEAETGI